MAAELTTGALIMYFIKKYKVNLSMLVISNEAVFSKKATGRITFYCNSGDQIKEAVKAAIKTKEPQTIWLESKGHNAVGEEVSRFKFEWSLKLKRSR